MIIISLLLLGFSLMINLSISDNEDQEEQYVAKGNPEASIGLEIIPIPNTSDETG